MIKEAVSRGRTYRKMLHTRVSQYFIVLKLNILKIRKKKLR